MSGTGKIPSSQVEQLVATELTDDILQAEIADILPLNELQDLEQEAFVSEVDTWLESLHIEYTTKDNALDAMAVVIGDTRYTIASPKELEGRIEQVMTTYIATLTGLQDEKEKALLSYVSAIQVESTLPTVDAVQQAELETSGEIFDRLLLDESNHTSLTDLLPGTPLYAVMQAYAEKNGMSVESLSEHISGTQQELIERFFVGIPLTENNKQVITTATSLYLFSTYAGDSELREDIFASEDALTIDDENFFGGIFKWTKEMGFGNIAQMGGLMQFFMVFKDPEIEEALTKSRYTSQATYEVNGRQVRAEGMANPYLENPHEMYELMTRYFEQPIGERSKRLKAEILAVNQKLDGATLQKFEVSDADEQAMKQVVVNYGGSPAEFEQFMGFVEKGDELIEQTDAIKTSLIENDSLGGMAGMLAQVREAFGSVGAAFGEDWENSSLFKMIDGLLGWLGFDGLDGYLDERNIHKTIQPLVEAYAPEDVGRTQRTSVFRDTLQDITKTDTVRQPKILAVAGNIDIHRIFALMTGAGPQKKDLLGAQGENLNALLPKQYRTGYDLQERFMYASAFVLERLVNSRLIASIDEVDQDDLLKWMMLFLASPDRSKKYFTIGDAHAKLAPLTPTEESSEDTEEEIIEESVDVVEHGENLDLIDMVPGLLPTRAGVADAMDEIIAHDKLDPIGYDFGDGSLGSDNDMDCSGMVCEIFGRAGIDISPRTSRGYFTKYFSSTTPIVDMENTGNASSIDLSNIQKGDLLFWNNQGDYQWKDKNIPEMTLGGEKHKVHHIAMILATDPKAGTIDILETAGSTGTIVRTVNILQEMEKRQDELWVSRMPYDV